MKLKDQAIEELKDLKPGQIMKVYDMILSLKRRPSGEKGEKDFSAYLVVREALRQCRGSLSEDILKGREDRV